MLITNCVVRVVQSASSKQCTVMCLEGYVRNDARSVVQTMQNLLPTSLFGDFVFFRETTAHCFDVDSTGTVLSLQVFYL